MIENNLSTIKSELSQGVTLVAVSKTKPNELILEAYNAGQRDFGENYIQELRDKYDSLPKDIHWHFIGHLQRNKVKYIAPFVYLIHGVDSVRLLEEINKQALKNNRVIDVLLQVHIADEETKFGFSISEIKEFLLSDESKALNGVRICGLMGMASNTENNQKVEQEFASLKNLFDWVVNEGVLPKDQFSVLSMGMSGDYKLAQKHGSTMVRIGSSIFGARNYNS